MNRSAKSQWEFGELFPREPRAPERKVLSVTELTWQIRRLLESQVGQVWVTGEVTNLRLQSSGHIYFTLKDAGSQLGCVLFRGETEADRSLLQDGRKVTLQGEITVYEPRGQYQMRVMRIELQGLGALQAAFEKLKQKLNAEGLFAPERKRPLPRYPQRIGLVTSPTGAAIRDVLHVIERRDPSLEIFLAPCRVQGDGAAPEIAASIRLLNQFSRQAAEQAGLATPLGPGTPEAQDYLDLILVTRGGGSLEDLWAFNEEIVARAIFDSRLPVVSGVGHEIDFTISDFVADVRAATPSAAAEIITEGVYSSLQFLAGASARLRQLAEQGLEDKRYVLGQVAQRLGRMHPRRRLDDWSQRLDEAQARLARCASAGLRNRRGVFQTLAERLGRVRPALLLKQRREVLVQLERRRLELALRQLRERAQQVKALEAHLRLLGPEQVLARGYSITMDAASGQVIRQAETVQPGQRLHTRLQRGEVISEVKPARPKQAPSA